MGNNVETMKVHFILYVKDQAKSTDFYAKLLDKNPTLFVPGMTEFQLSDYTVLGLMPETNIKILLGDRLPDPAEAYGIPRAELYLMVDEPLLFHKRALELGAAELSELQNRDWGDEAAYSLDPDGNVLAFAKKAKTEQYTKPI